jgi:hypothetical protein
MNVFALIALYPLALKVGGNKWCGVFAVLVAGLLSPMPMHYVNWGRYTQLAGQAILPVAVWLVWEFAEAKPKIFRSSILIWIALTGLFLTHYRVIVFMFAFYIALVFFNLNKSRLITLLKMYFVHGIGALLISLPWILRLSEGKLPSIFRSQLSSIANQNPETIQQLNSIGDLTQYQPIFLWVLMVLAVILGIWKRPRPTILVSLWWFFIFLSANPNLMGLPGSATVGNFALFIAIYIPSGILIGSLAGDLGRSINDLTKGPNIEKIFTSSYNTNRKYLNLYFPGTILLILGIGIGFWATPIRLRDVEVNQHALVTRPDIQAGEWIRDNLPEESRFLVNSFFAYQDTLVVGSDSGWWLPLIADRKTTQPPINYVTEQEPWPGYILEVNSLVEDITSYGINNPEVMHELQNRNITHVFIGQQQGSINGPPLLDSNTLLDSPNFRLVYHEDRVWIFEIVYQR